MNTSHKETAINALAEEIKTCQKCYGLSQKHKVKVINIIASRSRTGIGFWSDAYPNYDAKLMIVGQDWGSEDTVKNKQPEYEPYYGEPKNSSWKTLMKHLKDANFNTSGGEYAFTDIYLTNALLCAREGDKDSGYIPNKYFDNCYPFLKNQIDLIRPKIIATLGKTVFDVFARVYNIKYKSFYDEVLTNKYSVDGIILFPLCHTSPLAERNRARSRKSDRMLDDFVKLRILLDEIKD